MTPTIRIFIASILFFTASGQIFAHAEERLKINVDLKVGAEASVADLIAQTPNRRDVDLVFTEPILLETVTTSCGCVSAIPVVVDETTIRLGLKFSPAPKGKSQRIIRLQGRMADGEQEFDVKVTLEVIVKAALEIEVSNFYLPVNEPSELKIRLIPVFSQLSHVVASPEVAGSWVTAKEQTYQEGLLLVEFNVPPGDQTESQIHNLRVKIADGQNERDLEFPFLMRRKPTFKVFNSRLVLNEETSGKYSGFLILRGMNPEADAGAIRLVKGVFRLGDKSRSGDSLEIVDEAIQVDRSGKAIWRLSIPSERISSAASRAATQIGYFDVDGREFMLDVIIKKEEK